MSSGASSMASSVSAALQEGLENLLSRGAAFQLSKETIPVLESFINATDVLIESAEAVAGSTKDQTSREAILLYGKQLKVEAAVLQQVITNLSQDAGDPAVMRNEVVSSLTKIGEMTANLLQVEEDNDQKLLTQAARNCASVAKQLMSKTRATDTEMIEAARQFAAASLELVKVLNDLGVKYATTHPEQKEEVLSISNQIKELSPRLIEAVKFAHFQDDPKHMSAVVEVVKSLADQIARAITVGKVSPNGKSAGPTPPESNSSGSAASSSSSESQTELSRSRLGGGMGNFRMSRRGLSPRQSEKAGGSKVADHEEGLEVLKRARALSKAVTAQRDIRKELDVTNFEVQAKPTNVTNGSNIKIEDKEPTPAISKPEITTTGEANGNTKRQEVTKGSVSPRAQLSTSTPAVGSGQVEKEAKDEAKPSRASSKPDTNLMMRVTKLEVENKRLKQENEALKAGGAGGGGDEVAALRSQVAELEAENTRLKKELAQAQGK